MAQAFLEEAGNHSIQNVSLVESTWEDAQTQPADARSSAPTSLYRSAHRPVHRETNRPRPRTRPSRPLLGPSPASLISPMARRSRRIPAPLPAAPNSWNSWTKWASHPTSKTCQPPNSTAVQTADEAWQQTRGMLFLTEGSEKDRLLRSTIEDHLEQTQAKRSFSRKAPNPCAPSSSPGPPNPPLLTTQVFRRGVPRGRPSCVFPVIPPTPFLLFPRRACPREDGDGNPSPPHPNVIPSAVIPPHVIPSAAKRSRESRRSNPPSPSVLRRGGFQTRPSSWTHSFCPCDRSSITP